MNVPCVPEVLLLNVTAERNFFKGDCNIFDSIQNFKEFFYPIKIINIFIISSNNIFCCNFLTFTTPSALEIFRTAVGDCGAVEEEKFRSELAKLSALCCFDSLRVSSGVVPGGVSLVVAVF